VIVDGVMKIGPGAPVRVAAAGQPGAAKPPAPDAAKKAAPEAAKK
jgi:hypothetical protein